jgi:hypothetical protein
MHDYVQYTGNRTRIRPDPWTAGKKWEANPRVRLLKILDDCLKGKVNKITNIVFNEIFLK